MTTIRATASAVSVTPDVPMPMSHTTRLLCSSTLIDRGFAELVFKALCVPQVEAVAPAPGVDLVLLARHAAFAVHERRRMYRALCWYLLALAGAITGLVLAPEAAVVWAVVALAGVVGAKVEVVGGEKALAERAIRLMDTNQAERGLGAGMVEPEQEARLADVNDANLSIYTWKRADDPFPGLGQRLHAKVLPPIRIDQAEDQDQPLVQVLTSDLLAHLARTMPRYVEVANVTDAHVVQPMLYVMGTAVGRMPGLLPDRLGPPRQQAPGPTLQATADRPTRVSRTYLRAQVVGHGGQVITTLDVSAVVEPCDLLLDLAVHVLRPVHDVYHGADRLPRKPSALTWALVTRTDLGLLGAPVRASRTSRLLRDAREPATLTPEQQRAYGTQDFYGAGVGVREIASYRGEFDFNQATDATRQSRLLLVTVLREVVAYLKGCNVDTSALEDQQQAIVNNYIDATTNVVEGNYVSGGKGGINVNGNLTVANGEAPNLAKSGKH